MPKKNTYKMICQEIVAICNLSSDFSIKALIEEENIDITEPISFLAIIKEYRERLELDNHVICDDDELNKIVEEGIHIERVLAKEQLYGKN